jgi:single-strand DNA-binding protein
VNDEANWPSYAKTITHFSKSIIMLHATGNLTKDAELKTISDKHHALNFTIAETRRVFRQGKYVKEPLYIECTLWNRDDLAQYLNKGTLVQVVGEVTAEAGNNGKAYLKIKNALDLKFLSSGQRNATPDDGNRSNGQRTGAAGRRQPAPEQTEPIDDLPF